MPKTVTVAKNLLLVEKAINNALKASSRLKNATKLVAVSKTRPSDVIEKTLTAGQRIFGENRVQEAEKKWLYLKKR